LLPDSKKEQSQSKSTYKCLKSKPSMIVNRHAKYMKEHDIGLDKPQLKLPFLYWIPKMHKNPSKQRYIAASILAVRNPYPKK